MEYKSTEQLSLNLLDHLKQTIATIPDILSSVEFDKSVSSLDDVDKNQIEKELILLTFVGQRLAIQFCQSKINGLRDNNERISILASFDSHACKHLGVSPEIYNFLEERGEQYFKLMRENLEEIRKNEWNKFFDRLHFKFEQFCLGGGRQNDPVVLGSILTFLPYKFLSEHYWSEGYIWTFDYLAKNE